MQFTDQSRLVPALVALRDKYRARAIRMQERALPKVAKKPDFDVSGYMRTRDYYIQAAEAVDALIPRISEADTSPVCCVQPEPMTLSRSASEANVVPQEE